MDPIDGDKLTLLQWGIREGGAFVVILVILFFYRRDWNTAVNFWRDQHAITTQLVQEATKAQAETAAALRENNVVVHQAKQTLQTLLPNRRDEDHVTDWPADKERRSRPRS